MKDFHYVYILVSEADSETHYSGVTRDIKARLLDHNRGKCLAHDETQTMENRNRNRVPIRG